MLTIARLITHHVMSWYFFGWQCYRRQLIVVSFILKFGWIGKQIVVND